MPSTCTFLFHLFSNLFAFSPIVMAAPSMSCPSSGQFYACPSGSRFVGCCSTDPCGIASCPAGNLLAASFDPDKYDTLADQQCSGGLFFTCVNNIPPFWGCCKSDPCATGRCSTSDLAGAFLSGNALDAAPFLSLNDMAATSTLSTSGSTLSTSRSTSASISTATSNPTATRASTHVGAIVGGAVGGFAILAALIFSLLWLLHRRRDSKAEKKADFINERLDTDFQNGAVKDSITMSPCSPSVSSYPGSPELPSPYLPRCRDKTIGTHISQELPGSPVGQELESGQKFHPFKP